MDTIAKRSRLAYPARVSPGFDPYHPANNCQGQSYIGSFVCEQGPIFRCLNIPIQCTKNGTPSFAMTEIGPTHYSDGTNRCSVWVSPYGTVAPDTAMTSVTMAAIVIPVTTQTTSDRIVSPGLSGGQANYLRINSLVFTLLLSSATATCGPTLNTNEAYFVAASASGPRAGPGTAALVVRSLKSGALFTNSVTGLASGVQGFFGTWNIGGTTTDFNTGGYRTAAAMAANSRLSLAELVAWAEDPWAYWYPQPEENWVGSAALVVATLKRPTRNLYFR